MFDTIHFTGSWRCFKANTEVKFHRGVNLLVGDQGVGKSSLIQALLVCGLKNPNKANVRLPWNDSIPVEITHCGKAKVFSYDFEHDNCRIKSSFGDNIDYQIAAMFHSHGETVLSMIEAWFQIHDPIVLIVDEPDMALSIRSCYQLTQAFKHIADVGGQVIASVHNPVVISAFLEVYSLEQFCWLSGKSFIESQLKEINDESVRNQCTTFCNSK